jgi:hypothetical protein
MGSWKNIFDTFWSLQHQKKKYELQLGCNFLIDVVQGQIILCIYIRKVKALSEIQTNFNRCNLCCFEKNFY